MKSREKKNFNKRNAVFNVLATVCIIMFCIAISPVTMQNDTYYSVKIGEDISNYGIDGMDHYSWHDNLAYEYPHWLYDVIMNFIYTIGGWDGIYISTLVFASILGLVMYFTNVLFALTIFFIERFLKNRKIGYAVGLIIISLLIANLHVAVWPFYFVLFMPAIIEYLICVIIDLDLILRIRKLIYVIKKKISKNKPEKLNILEEKIKKVDIQIENTQKARKESRRHPYKIKIKRNKNVKYLIIVMLIAALMGLCTPLGDTPYTYLVKTMQGDTTENINEHLPLTLINQKDVLTVIIVIIAILMMTDIKIRLKDLLMFGGLVILMLMSRRQISIFALIGVTIACKILISFFIRYKCMDDLKRLFKEMTSKFGIIITICIFIIISVKLYKPKMNDNYVDESSYPVQACDYILENIDLENARFYNEYNYGSYMLFRGIPVFIDSRADLYTPEFNPGCTVFDDFLNISNIGTYYEDTFEEYEITHVICYKNAKLNMFLSRNYEYKELYSDEKFVIYERNIEE